MSLGLRVPPFIDVGSAWGIDESGVGIRANNAIRASAGFGVAWTSPFGPIRIDFAQGIHERRL
jgi:outer membrane protein insertion porin family